MNRRIQLYSILAEYIAGHYDTIAFCNIFYNTFYPHIPKEELSEHEYGEFKKLAYATARFSQYDEDFINCPKAFISEKEIQQIAKEVYDNLISN